MKSLRITVALAGILVSGTVFADVTEDFHALLDEHWEWTLDNHPETASWLGDKRGNDRWTDLGLQAIEARHVAEREFLRRTYAINADALSDEDRLNHELFRRELQDDVDEFQFNGHLIPFAHRGGIQNPENMTNQLSFTTPRDYEDWIARIAALDTRIEQTIALAERGRRDGVMPPKILMQRIPAQIALQVVESAQESPLWNVFENLPESFTPAERESIRAAATDAIEDEALPAFRKLNDYFNKTYLPAARETIGLSELPNGSAWYEHLARSFTTTKMTPDDIHRLGLEEVARIRAEMMDVIEEVGFDGNFDEFLVFLRTDPQFYFDTPEALYTEYLATSKRIDPELVKLFGHLPRMPYGVNPIPDAIAPDTTTAYYSPPSADGSRAGIYWVNLYRPEVRPKYEIEVLSVHEAMPGHHLQIAIQQELGDVPNFRRFMGFTAFVEGWGLYSERLGYDLGLYQDPYSRFGQLTYDMWRAVRLVVDTGMHYKGWTRQQAIDFFKDNAAKAEHDIVNEIDRYLLMPGQALAYKIGQLKMLQLRERATRELGDQFDIRAFHDHLLGAGALPLDLLEQRMDKWIAAER